MDFKKASLAVVVTASLFAGCSNSPYSPGKIYQQPAPKAADTAAPTALSASREQLAVMDDATRVETTLAWADSYLQQQRAADAGQLLDDLNPEALSTDQRYRWLLLNGQARMSQKQAQDTLDMLGRFQDEILQYPAEQQAALDLLRADALAANGKLFDSLQQRIAVYPMLSKADKDYNHEQIWQQLMQLPNTELAEAIDSSSGDLRGWLTLAQIYRDPIADPDAQVARLDQWSVSWRTHPAIKDVPGLMKALKEAASQRPTQVAVLLPSSGPLQAAGQALQEGIMTAYYWQQEKGGTSPTLRFYDSSADDILPVYQQAISDGADFVLGPLSKNKAAAIAAQGTLPVTTLALNYIDEAQLPDNFFQFGLAPEDEARQIALQGAREGGTQVGILYPEGQWGARVAQAFADQWQALGGTVSVSRAYQEGPSLGETVKELLLVSQSQSRGEDVSRYTNLKMDIEPRRRQDMSFLFLLANPNQGRQVKPALNFHYAKDLPVYATALIYSGEPNVRRDQDLDGVRFVDMPWILGSDDSELHQLASERWPDGHGRYERLFAMGIDAYRLQGRLHMLNVMAGSELPGVTGRLSMQDHRVVRELNWAVFVNGEVKALPQVTDSAPPGNRAAVSP